MRLTALLLALLLVTPAPSLDARAGRIIAIGDIHGSLEGFTGILKAAGLIDAARNWTGGTAQLVQTGDYTDRGEGTRAVMDVLMALEPQARTAGGAAIVLLGNHEVMNLVNEVRDVTPEIFATFADAQSEQRRQAAWDAYRKLGEEKKRKGEPVPTVYAQQKNAWLSAHPVGFVEYMEALSPRGKYGAWLREKPMVTELDGTIFMHAGIPPASAPAKIDDLNTQLRDESRRLDRFLQRLVERRLALPFFTLNEILQEASSEIGLANAIIASAKEAGKEPDRGRLDTPLLLEAQEVLKIDTWLAINGEKALW
ncbi:MAG: metallophosphoesterase [Acidimicrobiia bacterium]